MNLESDLKTEFEEKSEKIINKERTELIDTADKESVEDLKGDLDRVDLIKQAIEIEKNLV